METKQSTLKRSPSHNCVLSSEDERRHLSSFLSKHLRRQNLGHENEVRLPAWAPFTIQQASKQAGNSVPVLSLEQDICTSQCGCCPPVCVRGYRRRCHVLSVISQLWLRWHQQICAGSHKSQLYAEARFEFDFPLQLAVLLLVLLGLRLAWVSV